MNFKRGMIFLFFCRHLNLEDEKQELSKTANEGSLHTNLADDADFNLYIGGIHVTNIIIFGRIRGTLDTLNIHE